MSTEQGLSVLSFDGTQLAFPLAEAVSIQRSVSIEQNGAIPLAAGSVVYADRYWPVFSLNARFEPLSGAPPKDNMYCVCLSADDGQTGVALTCETLRTVRWDAGEPGPGLLPVCMQRDVMPFQLIYRHGADLLPVSRAPVLATYLRSLMKDVGDAL
jgi:hypothetical protein